MQRNGLNYKSPEQDEKEKAWDDCIKEEREKNPRYTDNDIMVMKLIQIDFSAQVSKTFTAGLDEYDIQMRSPRMLWYIIGVLSTIVIFLVMLIFCVRYAMKLRALEIAKRNKLGMQP